VDEKSLFVDAQVLSDLIFCVGGTVVSGKEKKKLLLASKNITYSGGNLPRMLWLGMEQ